MVGLVAFSVTIADENIKSLKALLLALIQNTLLQNKTYRALNCLCVQSSIDHNVDYKSNEKNRASYNVLITVGIWYDLLEKLFMVDF